jgi:hypothetical protein
MILELDIVIGHRSLGLWVFAVMLVCFTPGPMAAVANPGTTSFEPQLTSFRLLASNSVTFTVDYSQNIAEGSNVAWEIRKSGQTKTNYTGVNSITHTFNEWGTNQVIAWPGGSDRRESPLAQWTVDVRERRRGLYVDCFSNILARPVQQTNLLRYAQANKFDSLTLYGVPNLFYDQVLEDADQSRTKLASFIALAKTNYGIREIGISGATTKFFADLVAFFAKQEQESSKQFDVLNLEYEFWNQTNRASAFKEWLGLLDFMRTLVKTNQHQLLIEAYVKGYHTEDVTNLTTAAKECADIARRVDRLLLTAYYDTNPSNIHPFMLTHLRNLANVSSNLEVWPILSVFPESGNPFMRPWLKSNTIDATEEVIFSDFRNDTAQLNPNLAVTGIQYFTYTWMPGAMACDEIDWKSNVTNPQVILLRWPEIGVMYLALTGTRKLPYQIGQSPTPETNLAKWEFREIVTNTEACGELIRPGINIDDNTRQFFYRARLLGTN